MPETALPKDKVRVPYFPSRPEYNESHYFEGEVVRVGKLKEFKDDLLRYEIAVRKSVFDGIEQEVGHLNFYLPMKDNLILIDSLSE